MSKAAFLEVIYPDEDTFRSEMWDVIRLLEVPRVGEILQVERDDIPQRLLVVQLEHYAVPDPLPPSILPNAQLKEPKMRIICEFHIENQLD